MSDLDIEADLDELERRGWIIIVPPELTRPNEWGIILLRRMSTSGCVLDPHDSIDVARTAKDMGISESWLASRITQLVAQGSIAPPPHRPKRKAGGK